MVWRMYKSEVIAHFKNAAKVTVILELRSSGTVSQWGEIIPEKQALRLERLTNGKLKYNPDLYQKNTLSAKRG